MKKQIGFLLVMLVMLLTVSAALADNEYTNGPYTYSIKGNGTAIITKFDWKMNGNQDIYIPTMLDGYTVTGIGDEAFRYRYTEMTPWKLQVWTGLLENECNPYSLCVTLPNTIKTIGAKAFWGANISAINIPDSVEVIGAGAFFDCVSCQFKISPNQTNFAVIGNGLYNKAKKELISYSSKLDDSYADIIIPNGIVSIGDYAMAFFNKIDVKKRSVPYQTISFPDTVKKVGKYAFAAARFASDEFNPIRKVEVYSFPFSEIGEGAFMYAEFDSPANFEELELMGEKSFAGARFSGSKSSDRLLRFGNKLKVIPDGAFNEMNSEELSIDPRNLELIGRNNNDLGKKFRTAGDFSPSITTIPTGLYPTVSSLPTTITTIESCAFDTVTNFKLPISLESIAPDAFAVGSTFIVESGSYAELWCSENGFGYTIEGQNNLDWLNN